MVYLSPAQTLGQTFGYGLIVLFGLCMISITYFFARWKKWHTREGFLVAGRKVKWGLGGFSITASWIWAGALFVSTQMAYEKGFVGIFWFTLPAVLGLLIYAFLGHRIRDKFPYGYTLPQFIMKKFNSKRLHFIYLVPFFLTQLMAVTFNVFAGGLMISFLTGIPTPIIMVILGTIALIYTLISGLEASIVTDFVQMLTILFGIALIVPLTIKFGGGFSDVIAGFGGVTGEFTNILNLNVALSFGIVTIFGLLSTAIADQQYWQRCFAIKKDHISKAFIFGAILFALVPLGLSLLGFLGAGLGLTVPEGMDVSMIGFVTVSSILPSWVTGVFVIIFLAGLSSTIDSAFSAISSLWVTDVAKYSREERTLLSKPIEDITVEMKSISRRFDNKVIRDSRIAMLGLYFLGITVAFVVNYIPSIGLKHLFWITISIADCILIPTILSLYWKRISEKGVFYGVSLAVILGIPFFIYANILNDSTLILGATLFMIGISGISCVIFPKKIIP